MNKKLFIIPLLALNMVSLCSCQGEKEITKEEALEMTNKFQETSISSYYYDLNQSFIIEADDYNVNISSENVKIYDLIDLNNIYGYESSSLKNEINDETLPLLNYFKGKMISSNDLTLKYESLEKGLTFNLDGSTNTTSDFKEISNLDALNALKEEKPLNDYYYGNYDTSFITNSSNVVYMNSYGSLDITYAEDEDEMLKLMHDFLGVFEELNLGSLDNLEIMAAGKVVFNEHGYLTKHERRVNLTGMLNIGELSYDVNIDFVYDLSIKVNDYVDHLELETTIADFEKSIR